MGFFDKAREKILSTNRKEEPIEQDKSLKEESKKPINNETIDSAFELSEGETDFFERQQEKFDKDFEEKFAHVPDLNATNGKRHDVLDVLGIPDKYAIPQDYFMSEDLKNVVFDIQTPYGFEQGQVNSFVARTISTVDYYLKLLSERNEHIKALAEVIDRLQVDNNNLKYQSEIGNGINIMPTADADDLENRIMELKIENANLKTKLKTATSGYDLSDKEREKYDSLKNQFFALQREKQELESDNFDLRNKVNYLEEQLEESESNNFQPVNDHGQEGTGFALTEEEHLPQVSYENDSLPEETSLSLPEVSEEQYDEALSDNSDDFLPEITLTQQELNEEKENYQREHASQRKESQDEGFALDDDISTIELLNDNMETVDGEDYFKEAVEEDNEDELDKLMKDWNK